MAIRVRPGGNAVSLRGRLASSPVDVDEQLAICTRRIRAAEEILVRTLEDMTGAPVSVRRELEIASVPVMEQLADHRRQRTRLECRRLLGVRPDVGPGFPNARPAAN